MPITDREKHFMHLAIEESFRGLEQGHGGPFGCVIVQGDEVIARAHNSVINHTDPTAHAEVEAIRQACRTLGHFQLPGCEVYCSCEPCPMCLGALYWARPAKIFYANTREQAASIGFDDEFIYTELPLDAKNRRIPTEQIQTPEAFTAFEQWQRTGDKTVY